MEQRRKKLKDRKRTMEWRVWRKEVIVFLWLHILSALEICSFLV